MGVTIRGHEIIDGLLRKYYPDGGGDFFIRVYSGERRGGTAGFLFDVPVRFDTDYLEVDLSAFAAGAIPTIPLVEIRP